MSEAVTYRQQPCRRCGVSIQQEAGSILGRCACQKRRKPLPPSPGPVFAAFGSKPAD